MLAIRNTSIIHFLFIHSLVILARLKTETVNANKVFYRGNFLKLSIVWKVLSVHEAK